MTDESNTDREALRNAVGIVLTNAANFPEKVQARMLGQDMGPLIERVTDAVSDVWRNRQVSAQTREEFADLLDDIHGEYVTEGGCDFRGWSRGWRSGI